MEKDNIDNFEKQAENKECCLLPFERIKRDILVKKNAKTSSKFGENPFERPVEKLIEYGIVNIDKPKGPTSHQMSAYVQKILNINKSGHSGTLDPNVTGVLPVALGRATRIVQVLLSAGKEYVGIMHLHKEHSIEEIKKTALKFTGKIKQLPPIKSSVKRAWRFRKVYYFNIIESIEKDVLFKVGTQAGTYIRKLCHDFGNDIGGGAHMQELRRTKAGPFNEKNIFTLQDLSDSFYFWKEENNDKYIRKVILPIEVAVEHLPKVWILDSSVNSICHGTNLAVPGIAKVNTEIQKDETVAVMTLKNELVAIGLSRMTTKEMMKNEKGIAVVVKKVFMKENIYPKIEKEE